MDQYWKNKVGLEEGNRLLVYDDKTGKPIGPGSVVIGHPSIGKGRALDVHGISQAEADTMFDNDIADMEAMFTKYFPAFVFLNKARQYVLVDMAYNLGWTGLLGFPRMLAACWAGDFNTAAAQILASEAARELPTRYRSLAATMKAGADVG